MKSEARTAIALFGGAAILVFAVGCGGGVSKSVNNTTTPTPNTTTTTAPSPSNGSEVPSAPGGCIPHLNC